MSLKIMADNQVQISAKQDGALYNVAMGNKDFIIKDIGDEFSMTYAGLNVAIGTGEAVIHGRHVTAQTSNNVTLPANESGYLVLRIDLTQSVGNEALFYATPTLTKEEINWSGTIYDMPIATFTTASVEITNLNDIRTIKNELLPNILEMVYPVGSIYLSVLNTNPSNVFGGTWERLKDRFLLGAGDNYTAGATGGEASHTLTEAEMPNHSHSIPSLSGSTGGAGSHNHSIPSLSGTAASAGSHTHSYYGVNSTGKMDWGESYQNGCTGAAWKDTDSTGAHTHDVTTNASTTGDVGNHTHTVSTNADNTGSKGNGTAHNNMPPYLAVYMWKRIA